MTHNPWFRYLKNPIPRSERFSAYRFPGLVVHLPVFLVVLVLGFQLNESCAWLYPALVCYGILGLYLGRDLALHSHYNLYTLIGVLVFAALFGSWIAPLCAALRQSSSFSQLSLTINAALFLGFVGYVYRRSKLIP